MDHRGISMTLFATKTNNPKDRSVSNFTESRGSRAHIRMVMDAGLHGEKGVSLFYAALDVWGLKVF